MSKEEWLHICRLNMEWYFVQTVFDGKPLSKEDKEWINEHIPSDYIFDDGRIEFFQENFKPIIDEAKLEELANSETYNYISEKCKLNNNMFNELLDSREHGFYDGFVSGYRTAKSEQLI